MNKLLQYFAQPRRLSLGVVAASALVLSGAYVSQYVFGLKPCILCLYQRVPYFVNIGLGLAAFAATFRYPRLAQLLLYFAVLGFLADAAIAGFHVGVEQHWWKGLAACGGDILPQNATVEQLREALEKQNIVHCDQAAFVFLGISMAGYNFIISTALTFLTSFLVRKKDHGA